MAAFSPDGKRIATIAGEYAVRLWEIDGSRRSLDLKGHHDELEDVAWSPDGKRVVTASRDKTARVWELDGSGKVLALEGHAEPIKSVAFSPEGNRVATASEDKTARVWELDGSGKFLELKGHLDRVFSVAWSPDGKRVVTASADRTARIWQLDKPDAFVALEGHQGYVLAGSWSPDGKRVVTSSSDGTARVWDVDGQAGPVLKGRRLDVDASFSPDGKRIVTASDKVRVWDLDDAFQPVKLGGFSSVFSKAVFSPDQKRVVATGADGTAHMWDLDSPEKHLELRGPGDVTLPPRRISAFAWSPNSRRVAISYEPWSNTTAVVRVWDLDHPDTFLGPKFPESEVKFAVWSADGEHIVTVGENEARVGKLDGSGQSVVLKAHEGWFLSATFTKDGERVLTVSSDRYVRTWDLTISALVKHLHAAPTEWR